MVVTVDMVVGVMGCVDGRVSNSVESRDTHDIPLNPPLAGYSGRRDPWRTARISTVSPLMR